jgi:hypothetical protein
MTAKMIRYIYYSMKISQKQYQSAKNGFEKLQQKIITKL